MATGFPAGFNPGVNELTDDPRVSRPWLRERADKLLGVHLPLNRVPDWPDLSVVPGYQLNRVVPTHFRAYTRTPDNAVWADAAETWDEARWKLENRVREAGW